MPFLQSTRSLLPGIYLVLVCVSVPTRLVYMDVLPFRCRNHVRFRDPSK